MRNLIINIMIMGALCISSLIPAQVVLQALEAPYTSTQTRSYSRSFTRNNCSSGYTGSSVTYSQSATATATSEVSQADADSKAATAATAEAQRLVNAGGQAYANTNGTCTYNGGGGGSGGGGSSPSSCSAAGYSNCSGLMESTEYRYSHSETTCSNGTLYRYDVWVKPVIHVTKYEIWNGSSFMTCCKNTSTLLKENRNFRNAGSCR